MKKSWFSTTIHQQKLVVFLNKSYKFSADIKLKVEL